jgi:hypothetical protein
MLKSRRYGTEEGALRGMGWRQGLVVAAVFAAASISVTLGQVLPARPTPVVRASPGVMPAGLARAIRARLGAGPIGLGAAPLVSGIAPAAHGWSVKAPSAGITAAVSSTGLVTARFKDWGTVSLQPVSLGSRAERSLLSVKASSLSGGRLLQRSAALTTAYQVTPGGLEERFTVTRPLPGAAAELALSLGSRERWKVVRGGSAIVPTEAAAGALAYAGLRTTDVSGRVLPSRFVIVRGAPRIVVDISGARFPLTIDPTWTTTSTPSAVLTNGAGPSTGDELGTAVAVSQDGTTALVGAPGVNSSQGAAYIFHTTSEGSWSSTAVPVATLTNSAGAAKDLLGYSVALSSDGTTALVGAFGVNSLSGAAYVFHVSSEASWSSSKAPVATLTNSPTLGSSTNDEVGWSVALSSDGTTALVGAPGVSNDNGAAYIFQAPSEGSWASNGTPKATLTWGNAPSTASEELGYSAALSSDGTTALVSADGGGSGVYSAYVFHAPSGESSWSNDSTPAASLIPNGGAESVALSADGTTALVGVGGANTAYIFHASSESTWGSAVAPTATLTNAAGSSTDQLGTAVALSSDGATALVGAPGGPGAAYIFRASSESSWGSTSAPVATLTNGAGSAHDGLGDASALSGDGTTALVGALNAASQTGAAYIFASSGNGGGSGNGGSGGSGNGGGAGNSSGGPSGTTSGGSTNGGGSAPRAGTPAIGHPTVGATSVSVPLSCAGGSGSCSISLTLSVAETLRGGKLIAVSAAHHKTVKRALVLGTVRVRLAAGQHRTAVVRLNAAGRRLLAARHTLKVKLTVARAGQTIFTSAITFRAKHKRPRRR